LQIKDFEWKSIESDFAEGLSLVTDHEWNFNGRREGIIGDFSHFGRRAPAA
jgi:hypothetical protein